MPSNITFNSWEQWHQQSGDDFVSCTFNNFDITLSGCNFNYCTFNNMTFKLEMRNEDHNTYSNCDFTNTPSKTFLSLSQGGFRNIYGLGTNTTGILTSDPSLAGTSTDYVSPTGPHGMYVTYTTQYVSFTNNYSGCTFGDISLYLYNSDMGYNTYNQTSIDTSSQLTGINNSWVGYTLSGNIPHLLPSDNLYGCNVSNVTLDVSKRSTHGCSYTNCTLSGTWEGPTANTTYNSCTLNNSTSSVPLTIVNCTINNSILSTITTTGQCAFNNTTFNNTYGNSFSGLTVKNCTFNGSNISNVTSTFTTFNNTTVDQGLLTCCNINNCNMSQLTVNSMYTLSGSSFTSCIFGLLTINSPSTTMTNCTFNSTTVNGGFTSTTNCTFNNATLTDGPYVDCKFNYCTLAGVTLTNVKFTGNTSLTNSNIYNTTCNFAKVPSTKCNFRSCSLTNLVTTESTILDSTIEYGQITSGSMTNVNLTLCTMNNVIPTGNNSFMSCTFGNYRLIVNGAVTSCAFNETTIDGPFKPVNCTFNDVTLINGTYDVPITCNGASTASNCTFNNSQSGLATLTKCTLNDKKPYTVTSVYQMCTFNNQTLSGTISGSNTFNNCKSSNLTSTNSIMSGCSMSGTFDAVGATNTTFTNSIIGSPEYLTTCTTVNCTLTNCHDVNGLNALSTTISNSNISSIIAKSVTLVDCTLNNAMTLSNTVLNDVTTSTDVTLVDCSGTIVIAHNASLTNCTFTSLYLTGDATVNKGSIHTVQGNSDGNNTLTASDCSIGTISNVSVKLNNVKLNSISGNKGNITSCDSLHSVFMKNLELSKSTVVDVQVTNATIVHCTITGQLTYEECNASQTFIHSLKSKSTGVGQFVTCSIGSVDNGIGTFNSCTFDSTGACSIEGDLKACQVRGYNSWTGGNIVDTLYVTGVKGITVSGKQITALNSTLNECDIDDITITNGVINKSTTSKLKCTKTTINNSTLNGVGDLQHCVTHGCTFNNPLPVVNVGEGSSNGTAIGTTYTTPVQPYIVILNNCTIDGVPLEHRLTYNSCLLENITIVENLSGDKNTVKNAVITDNFIDVKSWIFEQCKLGAYYIDTTDNAYIDCQFNSTKLSQPVSKGVYNDLTFTSSVSIGNSTFNRCTWNGNFRQRVSNTNTFNHCTFNGIDVVWIHGPSTYKMNDASYRNMTLSQVLINTPATYSSCTTNGCNVLPGVTYTDCTFTGECTVSGEANINNCHFKIGILSDISTQRSWTFDTNADFDRLNMPNADVTITLGENGNISNSALKYIRNNRNAEYTNVTVDTLFTRSGRFANIVDTTITHMNIVNPFNVQVTNSTIGNYSSMTVNSVKQPLPYQIDSIHDCIVYNGATIGCTGVTEVTFDPTLLSITSTSISSADLRVQAYNFTSPYINNLEGTATKVTTNATTINIVKIRGLLECISVVSSRSLQCGSISGNITCPSVNIRSPSVFTLNGSKLNVPSITKRDNRYQTGNDVFTSSTLGDIAYIDKLSLKDSNNVYTTLDTVDLRLDNSTIVTPRKLESIYCLGSCSVSGDSTMVNGDILTLNGTYTSVTCNTITLTGSITTLSNATTITGGNIDNVISTLVRCTDVRLHNMTLDELSFIEDNSSVVYTQLSRNSVNLFNQCVLDCNLSFICSTLLNCTILGQPVWTDCSTVINGTLTGALTLTRGMFKAATGVNLNLTECPTSFNSGINTSWGITPVSGTYEMVVNGSTSCTSNATLNNECAAHVKYSLDLSGRIKDYYTNTQHAVTRGEHSNAIFNIGSIDNPWSVIGLARVPYPCVRSLYPYMGPNSIGVPTSMTSVTHIYESINLNSTVADISVMNSTLVDKTYNTTYTNCNFSKSYFIGCNNYPTFINCTFTECYIRVMLLTGTGNTFEYCTSSCSDIYSLTSCHSDAYTFNATSMINHPFLSTDTELTTIPQEYLVDPDGFRRSNGDTGMFASKQRVTALTNTSVGYLYYADNAPVFGSGTVCGNVLYARDCSVIDATCRYAINAKLLATEVNVMYRSVAVYSRVNTSIRSIVYNTPVKYLNWSSAWSNKLVTSPTKSCRSATYGMTYVDCVSISDNNQLPLVTHTSTHHISGFAQRDFYGIYRQEDYGYGALGTNSLNPSTLLDNSIYTGNKVLSRDVSGCVFLAGMTGGSFVATSCTIVNGSGNAVDSFVNGFTGTLTNCVLRGRCSGMATGWIWDGSTTVDHGVVFVFDTKLTDYLGLPYDDYRSSTLPKSGTSPSQSRSILDVNNVVGCAPNTSTVYIPWTTWSMPEVNMTSAYNIHIECMGIVNINLSQCILTVCKTNATNVTSLGVVSDGYCVDMNASTFDKYCWESQKASTTGHDVFGNVIYDNMGNAPCHMVYSGGSLSNKLVLVDYLHPLIGTLTNCAIYNDGPTDCQHAVMTYCTILNGDDKELTNYNVDEVINSPLTYGMPMSSLSILSNKLDFNMVPCITQQGAFGNYSGTLIISDDQNVIDGIVSLSRGDKFNVLGDIHNSTIINLTTSGEIVNSYVINCLCNDFTGYNVFGKDTTFNGSLSYSTLIDCDATAGSRCVCINNTSNSMTNINSYVTTNADNFCPNGYPKVDLGMIPVPIVIETDILGKARNSVDVGCYAVIYNRCYISYTGSDSNNGLSPTTPFKTFRKMSNFDVAHVIGNYTTNSIPSECYNKTIMGRDVLDIKIASNLSFVGLTLKKSNLTICSFNDVVITNSEITSSSMNHCNVLGSKLNIVNLVQSEVDNSNMISCIVDNCQVSSSIISNGKFNDTSVNSTNMSGPELTNCNVSNGVLDIKKADDCTISNLTSVKCVNGADSMFNCDVDGSVTRCVVIGDVTTADNSIVTGTVQSATFTLCKMFVEGRYNVSTTPLDKDASVYNVYQNVDVSSFVELPTTITSTEINTNQLYIKGVNIGKELSTLSERYNSNILTVDSIVNRHYNRVTIGTFDTHFDFSIFDM